MPAINYNFIIEQGSDFEINFQYNDQNNNPIDLSDINSTCVVLQTIPNSGDAPWFSTKKLQTGVSFTASNLGLITLKISNTLTRNYNFDTALYDLDIIQGDNVIRLAYGTITIQKRQTPFPDCNVSSASSTPIVTSTGGSTPSPTPTPLPEFENLCLETDCLNLDIYSVVYYGSGLIINDLSTTSGSIYINDNRTIENVELVVTNLNHSYPQDLQWLLAPPSGNKILLAANHKMPQNSGNFNFMFSNKAQPLTYLHNVNNGSLCNIYDKTSIIKYSNESLSSSFDHLFGHSLSGNWKLIIKDSDPVGSGTIGGWKLVITYQST